MVAVLRVAPPVHRPAHRSRYNKDVVDGIVRDRSLRLVPALLMRAAIRSPVSAVQDCRLRCNGDVRIDRKARHSP